MKKGRIEMLKGIKLFSSFSQYSNENHSLLKSVVTFLNAEPSHVSNKDIQRLILC